MSKDYLYRESCRIPDEPCVALHVEAVKSWPVSVIMFCRYSECNPVIHVLLISVAHINLAAQLF